MVRDKYYLFFSGYLIIHATGLRRSNTKKAGDNMKQIVCFGDSNTYGLIPGTTDRYDWNTRWTVIVGRTTIFDDPSFYLKFHKNDRDTFL